MSVQPRHTAEVEACLQGGAASEFTITTATRVRQPGVPVYSQRLLMCSASCELGTVTLWAVWAAVGRGGGLHPVWQLLTG